MRKYRKVLRDEVEDIVCDVCGNGCRNECGDLVSDIGMVEYATLEALWGYCSTRDGESYRCEMCEGCFEKVSAFIDSLKPPPEGS